MEESGLKRCVIESDVLLRAFHRYTGLEAGDDLIHRIGTVAGENQRSPEVGIVGKLKVCGHYAQNRNTLSIERDRLPHNARVGTESPRPHAVTKEDDIFVARELFFRRKYPTEFSGRAQQRKQAGSSRGANQPFRNTTASEAGSLSAERCDLFEDLVLLCPLNIVRIGEGPRP